MPKTQFSGYICGITTTYQQILIILDNFEIIFIGALFPPGTAVAGDSFQINIKAPLFYLKTMKEKVFNFEGLSKQGLD